MFPTTGVFLVVFGIVIINFPDILAYLMGFFFLFLGTYILLMRFIARRNTTHGTTWKFGGYEISKKK